MNVKTNRLITLRQTNFMYDVHWRASESLTVLWTSYQSYAQISKWRGKGHKNPHITTRTPVATAQFHAWLEYFIALSTYSVRIRTSHSVCTYRCTNQQHRLQMTGYLNVTVTLLYHTMLSVTQLLLWVT